MLLSTKQISKDIKGGYNDMLLSRLYDDTEKQKKRILKAVAKFEKQFGAAEHAAVITAPGRSEIAGNHTDHQQGKVLAASISLDAVSVASPTDSMKVRVLSEGYEAFEADISKLEPNKAEEGTPQALVRGVADGFLKHGMKIGGFDIYIQSDVMSGSGLSSSACLEVLIGTVFSYFYNEDSAAPYKIAMIGQYAENVYFGKPCGLMDQMACAIGGLVMIDFADKELPDFKKVPFEPESFGYKLCIIDTGSSHDDLTDDYASITRHMKSVSGYFGKAVLSELNESEFYANISLLRKKFGDLAVLRSIHYFEECKRVEKQRECLENDDFDGFLSLVKESGMSSATFLQNAYSVKTPNSQGVTLALALCSKLLENKGAYRLHGGGFAGTVQAYVPTEGAEHFACEIEKVFGKGKCHIMNIRPCGAAVIA